MDRRELIKKYIDFFKSKGHKEIQNQSLIPENDPTVLFTTAGMHPLVPFLIGQPHPAGKRLVNVQKCIRTADIEKVGNTTHHTFFEMLGNWSLGDYWKKEAIEYSFEFLTRILKIKKENISVTCFAGDKSAVKDTESEKIWKSLGINKIKFLGKEDNWWGPAGLQGPCGPDTEMFINGTEIWNDVFMQYNKTADNKYQELKQKNVDTGMGVERILAVLNNIEDNYLTECFLPIIKEIEKLSKKKYGQNEQVTRAMRIIADHIKASVFILAEKITPSNKERGYVLRRLIRRAIRYSRELGIKSIIPIALQVFNIYSDYPSLKNKKIILQEIEKEEVKFSKTLEQGMSSFNRLIKNTKEISGKDAFLLYQSYGFPIEMTQELAKEKKIKINMQEFEQEQEKHQQLSRTASAGVFKSGLADSSEQTTKLHTAAHMLLAALRQVLKKDIHQKGSNINSERLRFDFSFDRKLTEQELGKVEFLVNEKIKANLQVKKEELTLEQAKKTGAEGVFDDKYSKLEKVFVYTIANFSKEICSGPHVENIGKLGKFKIIKEESVAAGVRRIKAVLE